MKKIISTFKGTDKNMQCNGFQYEVGKKATVDGEIKCCGNGLHSCEAPFDVLRYYPNKKGNRFFSAKASGKFDKRTGGDDSKLASSEVTLTAEIGFAGLVKAQMEYTQKKANLGNAGGDSSNLTGGDRSNLAGGYRSNLAGGNFSNLAGGDRSNLAGGNFSNLAGGDRSNLTGRNFSNLAGGDSSNLAGGNFSNLAGGYRSSLAGGDRSNLAGGYRSNLAGGNYSLIVARDSAKAKAGINSVVVLSEWKWIDGIYTPVCVKVEIVDGKKIKADTWYTLKDGEFVEVLDED